MRSFLGAKILLYDQRALLLDGLYLKTEQDSAELDLSAVIEQMDEVMGVFLTTSLYCLLIQRVVSIGAASVSCCEMN